MELVNTNLDDVFLKVLSKAREILRETAPVEIDGKKEPLCSDEAISLDIKNNKLRKEIWYMNNLIDGQPTEATDAFMCFGTLDFGELFYLDKEEEGVEDFQKKSFQQLVRSGVVHFALAEQDKNGRYLTEYLSAEKADPPWFDGFLEGGNGKRYNDVCMLHWVAKKQTSSLKRLFGVAEKIMINCGYRYIFLQVGCKDQSKLAAYYNYNGLTIVMLAEEKGRSRSKRKRQSVIIKSNAEWGFVFWGWKDMQSVSTITSKMAKLTNLKF